MAYYYDMDWHDYPPDYNEWLEDTMKSREIGAKILITDDLAQSVDKQSKFLKAMSEVLALSFLEVLYPQGQDYPKDIKLFSERDASLMAMEEVFLHQSEPKPTLQKYIYMLYHKSLHDYAERIEWETKPSRTKHKDWATNTKEYKRLEDKFERLQEKYNELNNES